MHSPVRFLNRFPPHFLRARLLFAPRLQRRRTLLPMRKPLHLEEQEPRKKLQVGSPDKIADGMRV